MRRKLFALAAAVSAVLCVSVCALWMASFHRHWLPYWNWHRNGFDYYCYFYRGRLSYAKVFELPVPPVGGPELRKWADSRPIARGEWIGFEYARGEEVPYELGTSNSTWPSAHRKVFRVIVPAYALVALSAMAILGCWIRRGRRPAKPGSCPACGYDLRATPDRCPECGAVPPVAPS